MKTVLPARDNPVTPSRIDGVTTDAARAVREVGFGVARNDVLWDFNEKEPGV